MLNIDTQACFALDEYIPRGSRIRDQRLLEVVKNGGAFICLPIRTTLCIPHGVVL